MQSVQFGAIHYQRDACQRVLSDVQLNRLDARVEDLKGSVRGNSLVPIMQLPTKQLEEAGFDIVIFPLGNAKVQIGLALKHDMFDTAKIIGPSLQTVPIQSLGHRHALEAALAESQRWLRPLLGAVQNLGVRASVGGDK